jgi:hypothetical protein
MRVLLFTAAALAPGMFAQMSPGPLSASHQDLDGAFACAKCHVFGAGTPQLRCLDCHREIAHRLTEKRGYHWAQVKAGAGSNDCARCHSEHNGLKHRLVRWPVPKEKFDHARAGWKLEGKHAPLKCAECHTGKYIDPLDRAVLQRHDLNTTFAGLDPVCVTCHRDVHAGELSGRCTDCHSQDTWKNPPGFSHERTRYPLTGLHARLACDKCHRPRSAAAESPVEYKGQGLFQYCASCHKDPHGNAFSGDCQRCHTTGGWKQILPSNAFDHSQTDYPLLGKHRTVACKDCHKSENFKTHVAFARCLDCHQDQHGGQFARREDGGDCKACHNEGAWKPAHFTVDDHAKTAYPLLGKHSAVVCAKCHLPKGKATPYRVAFALCTTCHQDTHKGQFAAKPHSNRCEDCHEAGGWKPETFTLAAHNQTRFALKGAHVAVACSGCHIPKGGDTPFHPAAARCEDCHRSPHGKLTKELLCDSCHSATSWKERGRFDHNRTAFALSGRHAAVDCLACHKPTAEKTERTIVFRGAAKDCAGCHADVHAGQFVAGEGENECARCHTTLTWRPTEFDHSRHSTFRLDGAHDRVPCQMCHSRRQAGDGRMTVVYKGTPRECKQCHL